MNKQKDTNRENVLKEFSEEMATWIGTRATVDDNFVNSLKTYHNIEITQEEIIRVYNLMMCLYIDLALARFEDFLEPREKTIFEKALIEKLAYFVMMFSEKGYENREEATKDIENAFYRLLEIYRTDRQRQNVTIPQIYLAYLANPSSGTKLSEEIWSEYINSYIKEFEEANFRTQLVKSLNVNHLL